jgi:hypothetical protein
MTLAQSIAPAWFVLPVAAVALLVTAGHWVALARAEMPATRKRLRTANGLVMMMAVPILAYGFGVVDTSDHRRFVLTWMAGSGLIIIVLTLATLDLFSTFLQARKAQRALRDAFAIARAKAALEAKAAEPVVVAKSTQGANPPDA